MINTIEVFIIIIGLIQSQYILGDLNTSVSTATKQIYDLTYSGSFDNILQLNNPVIKNLQLEIRFENAQQLDLRIIDKDLQQYQIPRDKEPFKSVFNDIEDPELLDENSYQYTIQKTKQPFSLFIRRKSTNEVIYSIQNLQFSQYFISYESIIPSPIFFGLGERNQKGFRFREGVYTLMARDEPDLIEDGSRPGKHVYSSQPVYLMREKSGNFHVFMYKTSVPIDVIYSGSKLNFVTIGGVIHTKLFLGDNQPDNVIKQYHSYIGGWALQAFWSLGFHQSRWGYKNADALIDVIQSYKKYDIPLDVIWSDLDYMADRQIFAVNQILFPLEKYDIIQKQLGIHYIPLIDVAVGTKYPQDYAYSKGIEMDIFSRSPLNGERFKGYVWPGNSYFPDFYHPNISTYWSMMFAHLYTQVKFDGIWIDMNEPANFCNGECTWNMTHEEDRFINTSYIRQKIDLPYYPGDTPIQTKTLEPHLVDYDGNVHQDVHNSYGFLETYYTFQAQIQLGKVFPFILARSTFPGSGKFTTHWFGDNSATWDFMYLSVGQIFQFNIFGIPQVGADVCGFMYDTEERLCARWIQLGAIYPFFRNHNHDQARPQEFYNLGPTVLKSAQKNIKLRYSLLKWYYSLYVRQGLIGSVFKPVFFEFPVDQQTYRDKVLDTQILLGREIMAAPVLERDSVIRYVYFPKGTWYELISGQMLQKIDDTPRDHLIYCPYDDYLPIFLRGGQIILLSPTGHVQTTNDLNNQYSIVVAMDSDKNGMVEKESVGSFMDLNNFLNETEVKSECLQNNCLIDITLSILQEGLSIKLARQSDGLPAKNPIIVKQIIFYGIQATQSAINCFNQNQIEIECRIQKRTYKQNSKITFGEDLVFGGESQNLELKIMFAN